MSARLGSDLAPFARGTLISGGSEQGDVFCRLRETAPAFLIPAAWGVVTAAHVGAVSTRPVFVMHGVMCVSLIAFAAASWREMDAGVLRTWRAVIVAGTPFAFAGLAGFLVPVGSRALFVAALAGWILVPAAGFLATARQVRAGVGVYVGGAGLCVLGAALYAIGTVVGPTAAVTAGLVSVGIGQTAGILDAVLRY